MSRQNPFTAVVLAIALLALTASGAAVADDAESGQDLYEENCAACHGYDGWPMVPGTPNFAKGERLENGDDALLVSIREGKNDMPPWGEDFDEDEMLALVKYLRTLVQKEGNGQ